MFKERMAYFVGIIVIFNILLLFLILQPYLIRINEQIKRGGVIEAGVNTPLYHDYYYDYILVESKKEGDWQVDTYKEIKRLLDENGQKIKDVETGNVEYMRYWLGDPETAIMQFIDEDDHEHD